MENKRDIVTKDSFGDVKKVDNLIPIDSIEVDFQHFLQGINGNKRLFFSGRFGIGKTYFLKEFFISHNDEYETFHLFPVRYQINRNENIIDLLKYDILIELLNKNKEIFDNNKIEGLTDRMNLFLSFCREKGSINGFLQSTIESTTALSSLSPDPLFQFFAKLGRPLKDLLKVDMEFQKFKDEYKSGEKGVIKKFIDKMNKSCVVETDYLSHLLSQKILQQKDNKKSVLILDDIDRIDPDHIFRILNVFSSHFDDENIKFKFDHVIIVGDIESIQRIFHHKYGEGADFDGYFDKFYTVTPYYLKNKDVITEYIPSLVKKFECEEDNLKNAIDNDNGNIKLLLSDILIQAADAKKLTLRQLFKPLRYNFPEFKKGIFIKDDFKDNFQQMIDISIMMLVAIFGGDKSLVSVLDAIKLNIKDVDKKLDIPYEVYIGSMIKSLINITPEVKQEWNKYRFTINSEGRLQLDNKSDIEQMNLFYDTLIEYVRLKKYIKKAP